MRQCGGDAGFGHDPFGEGLAALQLRCLCGGTEGGEPGVAQVIRDAIDQRCLGSDDHQVDLMLARDGNQFGTLGEASRDRLAGGDACDSRVPWGSNNRIHARVGEEGEHQRVLTRPGSHDKHLHGATLCLGSGGLSPAVTGGWGGLPPRTD